MNLFTAYNDEFKLGPFFEFTSKDKKEKNCEVFKILQNLKVKNVADKIVKWQTSSVVATIKELV